MAAKETVNLTPAVAAARGSANSHPDQREEAALFAAATSFPSQGLFVGEGGCHKAGSPVEKTHKRTLWTKTERVAKHAVKQTAPPKS